MSSPSPHAYWLSLNPHTAKGISRKDLWARVSARSDWRELRNFAQLTPLMCAVASNPGLVLDLPMNVLSEPVLTARDASGRTLAFHLIAALTKSDSRQTKSAESSIVQWLADSPVSWTDSSGRGLLDQWEQDSDEASRLVGSPTTHLAALFQTFERGDLGHPGRWFSSSPKDVAFWCDRLDERPGRHATVDLPSSLRLLIKAPVAWNKKVAQQWEAFPELITRLGAAVALFDAYSPTNPNLQARMWTEDWLKVPVKQWPEHLHTLAQSWLVEPSIPNLLRDRIGAVLSAHALDDGLEDAKGQRCRQRL